MASIYPSTENKRAEDDGVSKFNSYLKFNLNKQSAIVAQFNQLKGKFDQFNRDDSTPEEDYRQAKVSINGSKLFPSLNTKIEGRITGTRIQREYKLSETGEPVMM